MMNSVLVVDRKLIGWLKMKNKYQVSLSCIKYYCGHFNKAVETAVKTAVKNLQE